MFGILKKKLSKAIDSISKKFENKETEVKKIEKAKEEIEKKIEPILEKKEAAEKILEEVKPVIEEKAPEMKKEVEKAVEEIKEEVKTEIKKIEGKPKEKKSFFKKVTEKILKKVTEKKLSEEDLEPILNELATGLVEADVAYEVAEKIKSDLKKNLVDKEIKRGKEKEIVVDALKKSLLEILTVPEIDLKRMAEDKKPIILLFLGFNGSGKTTSLAKIGKWLIDGGYPCVFAAADTFRAASVEQLEEHAKKTGARLIKHKYGADPAAVAFDAIAHAKANGVPFVLIDTAGRAHTNKNLMEQMQKIIRVNKPDLKILVIDSLTGNDAVLQARMFNEVGVDSVIFTKVDVNEKGGAILSVTHELKKPILSLSIGQSYEDFEKFDKEKFVSLLVES
jgi:fused signal recognition particle receptor